MIPSGTTRYSGKITVRSLIDGVRVTELESMKYCYECAITGVTIQEGYEKIGMEAFMYCVSMETLTLPASLKEIGYAAFRVCPKLKSVVFMGTSEQWKNVKIGEFNEALLNADIKYVGDKWQYDDNNDGTITIAKYINGTPKGVIEIPSEVDGKKVSGIGDRCFLGQHNITSVVVPFYLNRIGDGAFMACTSLESVSLTGVDFIGDDAFFECSCLVSIDFGGDVRHLGTSAFDGCSMLRIVNLPDSVEYIGDFLFRECSSLVSTNIPKNLKTLGIGVYMGCESLTRIDVSKVTGYDVHDGILYLTVGEKTEILAALPKLIPNNTKLEIDADEIRHYSFYGCTNISKLSFLSQTIVREGAFGECTGIEELDLNNIVFLGGGAFKGCTGLKSLTLMTNSYGLNVFDGCSGLVSVTVSENVSRVTSGLFQGCSSLEEINFLGLPIIDNGAFLGCGSSVAIHYGGTLRDWERNRGSIESDMSVTVFCDADWEWDEVESGVRITKFKNQEFYANSVIIPTKFNSTYVSVLGNGLFSDNEILEYITIPETVTVIEKDCFFKCYSLRTISLPDGLITLGDRAFYRCFSLTRIMIPSSCEYIGTYAFRECSSLVTVELQEGVTRIESYAFYMCLRLASLSIPSTMKLVKEGAFNTCPLIFATYNGTKEQYMDTEVITVETGNERLSSRNYDSSTGIYTYQYVTFLIESEPEPVNEPEAVSDTEEEILDNAE